MRLWVSVGAMALALLVAGCGEDDDSKIAPPPGGQKIAPIAAPAGSDWTQKTIETADGGHLLGNPEAPVKLLEYGSYGCGHCAHFEEEASEPLKAYIRSGRVSWEFRSYLIFPSDPAVSMLMRCRGPDAFFLMKEQLYASQVEWLPKLQQVDMRQLQSMSPSDRLKPLMQATGLDAFFRQRGMPQAKIDACLADAKALARVLEISSQGSEKFGVGGTPAFFINGVNVPNVTEWDKLEPQLKRALGE